MPDRDCAPRFPLPLGPNLATTSRAILTEPTLLGPDRSDELAAVCHSAGTSVLGVLLAVAATLDNHFTNADRFAIVVPRRGRGPREGPHVGGGCVFLDLVEFRSDAELPELVARAESALTTARSLGTARLDGLGAAPERGPALAAPVLAYVDATRPDASALAELGHPAVHRELIRPDGVCIWIRRTCSGLSFTAVHPANPTARDSIRRYLLLFEDCLDDVIAG